TAEPSGLLFCNRVMDRTAMKQFISGLVARFGAVCTAHILDQLKTLGFQQATYAAVSLGIDDLLATPSREWLVRDAELRSFSEEDLHRRGNVHAVEKLRRLIEEWYATSEYIKMEVSLNFGMTDPLNPVHMMSFSGARGNISQVNQLLGMRGLMLDPKGQIIDLPIQSNFREGLTLTEYIISCYGARKGIVDIAIRTADAGYLTRRLVEVAQRVVARRTNCGTIRSILVSPIRDQPGGQAIARSKLIGRILANSVYVDKRCIAIRDQDVGTGLAKRLTTVHTRPINIRSPLTCESMFWVCRLCYGWSLTHRGLVGLGEAVGIIAGQSIGEPGTQLTLRTFHTGGIFTGDTAQHVRAPLTGIIRYNATLAHLTRTRHGRPAWICRDDLVVAIHNGYEGHSFIIPSRSFILVKDNQHVESRQVLAEVHTATPAPREMVHRCIHSDMYGELHVGARVRHNFERIYSNIQLLPETSHAWVLSGESRAAGDTQQIFHSARDKIDAQSLLAGRDSSLPELNLVGTRSNPNPLRARFSNEGEPFANQYMHYRSPSGDLAYPAPLQGNLLPRGVEIWRPLARVTKTLFLGRAREEEQLYSISENAAASPIVTGHSAECVTKSPGAAKCDTVGVHSKENSGGNWDEAIAILAKIRGGAEEVRFSSLLPEGRRSARNRTLCLVAAFLPSGVHVGAGPAESLRSNRGWLAEGSGGQDITSARSLLAGVLPVIAPRAEVYGKVCTGLCTPSLPADLVPGAFDPMSWKHYDPRAELPVAGFTRASSPEPAEERNTTRSDSNTLPGAPSGGCSSPKAELAGSGASAEIGGAYFLPARYFPSYPAIEASAGSAGCGMAASFQYSPASAAVRSTGRCYSGNRSVFGSRGIIRISPTGARGKAASFLILSPDDVSNVRLSTTSGYGSARLGKGRPPGELCAPADEPPRDHLGTPRRENGRGLGPIVEASAPIRSSRNCPFSRKALRGALGVLGNPWQTVRGSTCSPRRATGLSSTCGALLAEGLNIRKLQESLVAPAHGWVLRGEDGIITRGARERTQKLNYSRSWNRARRLPSFLQATLSSAFILGQFICVGVPVCDGPAPRSRSCQVKAIDTEFIAIRSAEPYLADGGATIFGGSGGIVGKGDTLMTLIRERLRFEDIIFQGLPKIEQFLESRSGTSVSTDLKDSFGDWNSSVAPVFGRPWGYLLSARISLERSQITLVDRIGRGYRSQGVLVADKHVEMIVRQVTSRLSNLEDGMANASLPGELTEDSRAHRRNRALEAKSTYSPLLLGVTVASLNTKSFLSEASFRDTTGVLARAAIQGQIDWLKGLKENVIIGGTVPVGTGLGDLLGQVDQSEEPAKDISVSAADGGTQLKITAEHLFLLLSQRRRKPGFRFPGGILIHDASA
uniref:DNA-directed RNA polymerase subunit beta'' n=1 Tax=Selaginella lyallii TaxID=137159 RepID=A0A481ZK02_9TRAC|nr:RNA polymerase beta' subunit [Selaginella lyallii]QBL02064.1 RNA polymerase beta' subunit [Selaginella lyallii]